MKSIRTLLSGVVGLAVLTLIVGCPAANTSSKGGAKTDQGGKDDHGPHGAGPHGGAVGDWGGGKMHVEFTVDHDKQEATVYILDGSIKKPVPIMAKDGKISASIKGVKNKDAFEVELMAAPQEGDPEGKASRFVGKHEKIGVVQEFEGTITGENEGTPYTGTFKEEPAK